LRSKGHRSGLRPDTICFPQRDSFGWNSVSLNRYILHNQNETSNFDVSNSFRGLHQKKLVLKRQRFLVLFRSCNMILFSEIKYGGKGNFENFEGHRQTSWQRHTGIDSSLSSIIWSFFFFFLFFRSVTIV